MFVRANFVDIYSQGKRDRSVRSETELAWEIKLIDWSMAGNLEYKYHVIFVLVLSITPGLQSLAAGCNRTPVTERPPIYVCVKT